MNRFTGFGFSADKALARELVQRLTKEIPASLIEKKRKLLSVNKVTRLLENSFQVATDYQLKHRLGFVRRAVFANSFKWALKESGYPNDFVEIATEGLVVAITKAKGSPPLEG